MQFLFSEINVKFVGKLNVQYWQILIINFRNKPENLCFESLMMPRMAGIDHKYSEVERNVVIQKIKVVERNVVI